MLPAITNKLAQDIFQEERDVKLLWHAGEPMASGLKHFKELYAPFVGSKYITNVIQTNATIIDDSWCEFFKKNDFYVGVSIDGPEWANSNRVGRKGQTAYNDILKGIQKLKDHEIDFVVIAVVDFNTLDRAEELYSFFCELGCSWVGINLEENECVNQREICDDDRVLRFWEELFDCWYKNPIIELREISSALSWFQELNDSKHFNIDEYHLDLLASVAYNGDIVVLSPELLGGKAPMYNNFIVGNVAAESIFDVEKNIQEVAYVKDFSKGVLTCKAECEYFSFCRGGQASNKFYETGDFTSTETKYCRNSKKRVVDAIINQLNFQ